jgi:hypothetical protein
VHQPGNGRQQNMSGGPYSRAGGGPQHGQYQQQQQQHVAGAQDASLSGMSHMHGVATGSYGNSNKYAGQDADGGKSAGEGNVDAMNTMPNTEGGKFAGNVGGMAGPNMKRKPGSRQGGPGLYPGGPNNAYSGGPNAMVNSSGGYGNGNGNSNGNEGAFANVYVESAVRMAVGNQQQLGGTPPAPPLSQSMLSP